MVKLVKGKDIKFQDNPITIELLKNEGWKVEEEKKKVVKKKGEK